MITYNHEPYIREAIEGVLMQQSNFNMEMIIAEDCSTDNTRQICQEYASNSSVINLLPSESNLGMMSNFIRSLQACTGKYIALCEGDDYWTDPCKLQKQVDFLESNPDFAICFHNVNVVYDDGRETHLSNSSDQKKITTIKDLAHGNYIYTASCVFRNGLIKELPSWFKLAPVGDYALHMLVGQYGKIRFLDDVMGVYRVHKDGIWENKSYIFRIEKWVELLNLMKNHFTQEVNEILIQTLSNYYSILLTHYQNDVEKSKYYSKLKIDNNPFLIFELNRQIEDLKKTYKIRTFVLKPFSFLKRILNA